MQTSIGQASQNIGKARIFFQFAEVDPIPDLKHFGVNLMNPRQVGLKKASWLVP